MPTFSSGTVEGQHFREQVNIRGPVTLRNCVIETRASSHINCILSSGQEATIDGCFLRGDNPGGVSTEGIFFPHQHAGRLNVRNTYLGNMSDNAAYCDGPNQGKGYGGTVHFDTCLLEDNNISHLRLGQGCTVANTVVRNSNSVPQSHTSNNSRGCWTAYSGYSEANAGTVECQNTHIEITSANTNFGNHTAFYGTSGSGQGEPPEWHFDSDSAVVGPVHGGHNLVNNGSGTSADTTFVEPYVPMSPSDALHGNFNDSLFDGSAGGTPDPDPEYDHTFEIDTPSGGQLVNYEFDATGEIVAGPNAEPSGNDSIAPNADGTTTVSGQTGNGQADDWELNGAITSFTSEAPASAYTLRFDGTEVTTGDLPFGKDSDGGDEPQEPRQSGAGAMLLLGAIGVGHLYEEGELDL